MNRVLRLLPTLLFLALGVGIVLISLFSANRVFSQGEMPPLARQKLYFQPNIMPDHLLYPVFMAFDRAHLEMLPAEQKVSVHLEYAWKRLEYTEALLKEGYQSLSFSTLTKAHKHYVEGLSQAQSLGFSQEKRQFLIEDSARFQAESHSLLESFSDDERHELARLHTDLAAVRQFFVDSL